MLNRAKPGNVYTQNGLFELKAEIYEAGMLKRMKFFKNSNTGAVFLILEGIVYTMVLNLYNPFIQMFAKRMGAEDIHIALLNAAPPLVAVFVLIPFGMLIERISRKRQTVMLLLFINSFFYAAIAFVPVIPHQAKVLIYVILIGLMNWPGSLYLTTWQSFFADNFSGSYANRVYSLRSKYSTFFGLLTVLATGLLLTTIPKSDGDRLILYQIFYGFCFGFTLLQLFLFSRVSSDKIDKRKGPKEAGETNAEEKKPSMISWKSDLTQIFKNKTFMVFCLCSFVFHFAWQMGWPLFFIYNVDYAGLNEFQLSLTSVAAGLTQFLSFSVWNKLIDKKGSNLVIIFGAAGLAVNPLLFTIQQSFFVILVINIFIGIFAAGYTLNIFLGLLEILPADRKTVYISAFNTLTSISGFIAPLIGVWIYNRTNIYMAMGLIGSFRIAAVMFYIVRWLSERKGRRRNFI